MTRRGLTTTRSADPALRALPQARYPRKTIAPPRRCAGLAVRTETVGGYGCHVFSPENPGDRTDTRVLHFHGGAFVDGSRLAGEWYAVGDDPTAPEISPVYADYTGFPPVLIVTGTREGRRAADQLYNFLRRMQSES